MRRSGLGLQLAQGGGGGALQARVAQSLNLLEYKGEQARPPAKRSPSKPSRVPTQTR